MKRAREKGPGTAWLRTEARVGRCAGEGGGEGEGAAAGGRGGRGGQVKVCRSGSWDMSCLFVRRGRREEGVMDSK
jgi:hypothetical protein